MFGSKKQGDTINTSLINTIIGNNSKVEGILTASESTRIDGVLEGKIMSESSVIIGESGEVIGDITAAEILVAGIVYGNLVARERIEMTSTGRVLGDLITKTLVIDEGASFKGNCTMEVAGEEKMTALSQKPVHIPEAVAEMDKLAETSALAKEKNPKEQPGKNKKEEPRKSSVEEQKKGA